MAQRLFSFLDMVTATDNFSGPGVDLDKYDVHEDIPLFDEHVGEDGVYYDQRLLTRIAQNNNRRIEDTGDYVPVVQWHTKDDGDPDEDPPVLGYAGPFYVGTFGRTKPRPCIYAKSVYIFKEAEDIWRKRPRRSVEMWPEDKPENRYFDPIALLGAETPKRDLGLALTYSKSAGAPKIRYSMGTAAAGGNTFVPGTTGGTAADTRKRKRRRNAKDDDMGGDVEQIVSAVTEVVDQRLKTIEERLLALEGGGEEPPVDDLLPPGDGDAPGAPPMEALGGGEPPAEPPVDEVPPELDEEEEQFGGAMAGQFKKRYMEAGDEEGAQKYMAGMDEGDRGIMDRYYKYSCSDDGEKEFYAKACGKDSQHYQKATPTVMKYRKEREELAQKYAKAEQGRVLAEKRLTNTKQQLANATQELEDRRREAARSNREVVLYQKAFQGYSFDMGEECERVGQMSDAEFDRHVETMENYPRVPTGDFIPVDQSIPVKGADKSRKYAKRAGDVVQQYRKQGVDLKYREVLDHMVTTGSGDFDLEKFNAA